MNNLLSILLVAAGLITSIAVILAAIGSLKKAPAEGKVEDKNDAGKKAFPFLLVFCITVLLVLVFITAAYLLKISAPVVATGSPFENQSIEVRQSGTGKGACYFTVSGTSANLFVNRNYKIYVLIQSVVPALPGWTIQQEAATVYQNGQWIAQSCWIGDDNAPPAVGNKFVILAVAANPKTIAKLASKTINNIMDISPAAQSYAINTSIVKIIDLPVFSRPSASDQVKKSDQSGSNAASK